jgi:hypothetical protein
LTFNLFFQAVVETTPPSLRRAPPTSATPLLNLGPQGFAGPVDLGEPLPPPALPEILANIPGIRPELLTNADLLLADPATHTHPLGSHSLLPLHPGYDVPHSHPPFNQHPVIDVATGDVISNPGPEVLQLHPEHHPVHSVHAVPVHEPSIDEYINSVHAVPAQPGPYGHPEVVQHHPYQGLRHSAPHHGAHHGFKSAVPSVPVIQELHPVTHRAPPHHAPLHHAPLHHATPHHAPPHHAPPHYAPPHNAGRYHKYNNYKGKVTVKSLKYVPNGPKPHYPHYSQHNEYKKHFYAPRHYRNYL